MQTTIYKNWLSKTQECGFTNEQACGLAILYAWNLTSPKSENETPDSDIFWNFVEKNDFDEINKNSFLIDDFIKFIPILKLAGEMLNVPIPNSRVDGTGEPTSILNMDWQDEPVASPRINDILLLRHRFDLLWCQYVGESLREEIRTPMHAYAFADYLTHGFIKFDPEGYSRILHNLLRKQSPIVSVFTSKYFVGERNGLLGHEPFQIALLGFMSNLDPKLGEQLWNIQRVLFYKQPSGDPVNLEKQDLPLTSFLEFAIPTVMDFIDNHESTHADLNRLVASEYIYRGADYNILEHFTSLMESRYGFSSGLENESKSLNLLINAAAFYTFSCLKIRNLKNRISELPSLRMLDDAGLLWARDVEQPQPLKIEAVQCFDVMLSWRSGASWGLFLETEAGFIQRAYIGDTTEYDDVDDLFAKICSAYKPVRCVIALWTHRPQEDDLKSGAGNEVVFISMERDGTLGCDVYRGETDTQRGRYLGEYLGFTDNDQFCRAYFVKVQRSFTEQLDSEKLNIVQQELLEGIPFPNAWNFSLNQKVLEDEMNNVTSDDFQLEISGVKRGFFWPFKKSLISKLNINVPELESLLEIDVTAEENWFDLYAKLESQKESDVDVDGDRLKIEAEEGNPFSQNDYASALDSSDTDKNNEALKYYFDSAAQGLPYAQVTMGWFLMHGLNGVERNLEEAFIWNNKGAKQGHPEGANNVAFQYENGLGVKLNLQLAIHWYKYASIRGSSIAHGHLLHLLKS